jgi:hypothetical protein
MHKDKNLNWNDEKPAPKKRRKKDRHDRLKDRLMPRLDMGQAEAPLSKDIINMAKLGGFPIVGFKRDKSAFGRF